MNTYNQVKDIIRFFSPSNHSANQTEDTANHNNFFDRTDIYTYVPILSAACETASLNMGVPVVIAIVDAGGNIVFVKRLKGALLLSLDIAPAKAYTAVAFQMNTDAVEPLVRSGAPLAGIEIAIPHKIVTFGGGVPLIVENQVIGAIGISGGTVEQDIAIAKAGQQAMQRRYYGTLEF